jgi:protein tyrosine phosphatase
MENDDIKENEINNEEKKEEIKENKLNSNMEENKILELINNYFNGPNKDENNNIQDISYTEWVEKNTNIKKLCESYEVEYSNEENTINTNSDNNIILPKKNHKPKNLFGVIENHDFSCELKLLKWITEDEKHKNKFIKIDNKGQNLNRHSDILPYEYNIVPLNENNKDKKDINNYINASYISSPFDNKTKLFIATQTPLENTISSFWKMIYDHKIKLIIMLSNQEEETQEKYKIYWPNNKENILKIKEGEFNLDIELIHKEEIAPQMVLLRKFKLNNEFEVKQIQVISWPEHGLPGEEYLVNMIIEKMIKHFEEQKKDNIPVVVHCCDGVGRTGTIIAIFLINMCLEELKKMKKEPIMCVFNVVRKLREQRYSFVTDIEQYKYIYDFALYWIKKNYPLD